MVVVTTWGQSSEVPVVTTIDSRVGLKIVIRCIHMTAGLDGSVPSVCRPIKDNQARLNARTVADGR